MFKTETETSTEEITIAELLVCFLNEIAVPNVTSIETTVCFVIFCGYFGRAKSKNRLKKAEQKVLKRQTKKTDNSKNKQYCGNYFLEQLHVNFAKMFAYFKKFTIKRNKKIEIVKEQEDDNTNQMNDKETLDIIDKNDDTDVAE